MLKLIAILMILAILGGAGFWLARTIPALLYRMSRKGRIEREINRALSVISEASQSLASLSEADPSGASLRYEAIIKAKKLEIEDLRYRLREIETRKLERRV